MALSKKAKKKNVNMTPSLALFLSTILPLLPQTPLQVRSLGPDLKLGLKLLVNKLEQDHRFLRAKEAVEGIISEFKYSKVWLAGHSLGSAIALLVGKKLISTMDPIETYLFNPPFPSTHVEWIKNHERLKQGIRNLKSVATAGVAIVTRQTHPVCDSFSQLDSWMPYLFVNPSDIICSGYIGYFEQRHHVQWISRLAPHHTFRSLFSNSEPFHLLPSAILTINNSPSSGLKEAHELQQWWRSDNDYYESKPYRFSDL